MIPEREHVKKPIMPSEGLQNLIACDFFFHSYFYTGNASRDSFEAKDLYSKEWGSSSQISLRNLSAI